MSKPYKPILNLDFDGVIHSYSSGWKGAATIPDPPVPGALEFIHAAIAAGWDVCIHSSRSHQWGGRRAMKQWLIRHYREMFWQRKDIQDAAGDPYSWTHADIDEDALQWGAHVVQQVRFPWFKPAATVSIDDRAITFTGTWPDLGELRKFKPWNKQTPPADCAGGIRCTDCPGKDRCKTGCIRQPEFISTSGVDLPDGSQHG